MRCVMFFVVLSIAMGTVACKTGKTQTGAMSSSLAAEPSLETENGWCHIRYQGDNGVWVNLDYRAQQPSQRYLMTKDFWVNAGGGPLTSDSVVEAVMTESNSPTQTLQLLYNASKKSFTWSLPRVSIMDEGPTGGRYVYKYTVALKANGESMFLFPADLYGAGRALNCMGD